MSSQSLTNNITNSLTHTQTNMHTQTTNGINEDTVLSFIYKDLQKSKEKISNIISQSKRNRCRYQKLQINTRLFNKHKQLYLSPSPHLRHNSNAYVKQIHPKSHAKLINQTSNSQIENFIEPSSSFNQKQYFRMKIKEVEYDHEWNKKMDIPSLTINDRMIKHKKFQANYIIDQITILLDNIRQYKTAYFGDKNLIKIISSKGKEAMKKYNKLIEEIIVLMHQIVKGMLMKFYDNIDKFLSVSPPDVQMFCARKVKEEDKEIVVNVQFLSEMNIFLKGCGKVFEIIMSQTDSFILHKEHFFSIKQFLERCRLNVSLLSCLTQNMFKNYSLDTGIVEQYFNGIKSNKKKEEDKVCRAGNIIKKTQIKMLPKGQFLSRKELGYSENYERTKKLKEMFEE